jgi:hypothetical protein
MAVLSQHLAGRARLIRCSLKDATAFVRKHKTVDAVSLRPPTHSTECGAGADLLQALDAFYDDAAAQASIAGGKGQEKKLGDIWERFKGELDSFPGCQKGEAHQVQIIPILS